MRIRIVITALALSIATAAAAGGAEIEWQSNFKSALGESATSGKPLIVDVWAIWCVPCKQMDETTYRDPEMVAAASAFVPLKVDHDLQEQFVERYDVEALPLLLFLDSKGREISRIAGHVTPDELRATMSIVSTGYAGYMEAVERGKDPEADREVGSYLLDAGNAGEAGRLFRRALKALKGEPAALREPFELLLAQAQLADDELKPAAATFERLAADAEEHRVRGLALVGLAAVQQKRDGDEGAAETLRRLRDEYPELAESIAAPAP